MGVFTSRPAFSSTPLAGLLFPLPVFFHVFSCLTGPISLNTSNMKFRRPLKVKVLVDFLGPLVEKFQGDLEKTLTHLGPIEQAQEGSLVYALDQKHWKQALESRASCILSFPKYASSKEETSIFPSKIHSAKKNKSTASPPPLECGKTLIFSPHPLFVVRQLKHNFILPTPYRSSPKPPIHPTALIAPSAQLASRVSVGPYAIVGENCKIGENTFIGSHSVIEEGAVLGSDTTIHPHVYVGHSCQVGSFCEIMPQAVVGSEGYGYVPDPSGVSQRIPHTGKVILEDHVHVGAGTTIDRGSLGDSIVKSGTKIDNLCHLAHNCSIGKNSFITAHFAMGGSSSVGDRFLCGGQTGLNDHIHICQDVQLVGGSIVHKSITEPGVYGGYIARPVKKFIQSQRAMEQVFDMKNEIKKLMKKVFG